MAGALLITLCSACCLSKLCPILHSSMELLKTASDLLPLSCIKTKNKRQTKTLLKLPGGASCSVRYKKLGSQPYAPPTWERGRGNGDAIGENRQSIIIKTQQINMYYLKLYNGMQCPQYDAENSLSSRVTCSTEAVSPAVQRLCHRKSKGLARMRPQWGQEWQTGCEPIWVPLCIFIHRAAYVWVRVCFSWPRLSWTCDDPLSASCVLEHSVKQDPISIHDTRGEGKPPRI